ncbi:hypothetical protein L2E82_25613 [Cichorium intybus]|uniref:Uncharacterized protein n=1 Tax=Cichorium intybus TaxID=13427 RepID=A0ACB9E424_CICIN|nr:hypothetical protein L2E82_25613 [Cichorium intybus]
MCSLHSPRMEAFLENLTSDSIFSDSDPLRIRAHASLWIYNQFMAIETSGYELEKTRLALRAFFENKEEKEAVDGGSKASTTVEASRGEKEAVVVDGEKETVMVGGEKEAVAVSCRSKAAVADERHHSVVMRGRRKKR